MQKASKRSLAAVVLIAWSSLIIGCTSNNRPVPTPTNTTTPVPTATATPTPTPTPIHSDIAIVSVEAPAASISPEVTFKIGIKNLGQAVADCYQLDRRFGDKQEVPGFSQFLPPILPGPNPVSNTPPGIPQYTVEGDTVFVTWKHVYLERGTYTAFFTVTPRLACPYKVIPESNTANNIGSARVVVTNNPRLSDLAITGIATSVQTDERGEEVTYKISITNNGRNFSTYPYTLKDEPGDRSDIPRSYFETLLMVVPEETHTDILAPGETVTIERSHIFKKPGTYTASFLLYAETETIISNNFATETIDTKVYATMGNEGLISIGKPVLSSGEPANFTVKHVHYELSTGKSSNGLGLRCDSGKCWGHNYPYEGWGSVIVMPEGSNAMFNVELEQVDESCVAEEMSKTNPYYSPGRLSRTCTTTLTGSITPTTTGDYSAIYVNRFQLDEIGFSVE